MERRQICVGGGGSKRERDKHRPNPGVEVQSMKFEYIFLSAMEAYKIFLADELWK